MRGKSTLQRRNTEGFRTLCGALLLFAAAACAAPTTPDNVAPARRSAPPGPVPASYFGMHLVAAWAPDVTWPSVPVGTYRLLNATPRWHALHVAPGSWADDPELGQGLSRIEAALLFQGRHGPAAEPLYVIGGGDGENASGIPPWVTDTAAAWREHVRELGTRFRGRIRLWEVWNEAGAWCGCTPAQLVELTAIARAELMAIDPANRIISPSWTDSDLQGLDAFLAAGGGSYVDVVGWHMDNAAVPELDTAKVKRVRGLMRAYGVSSLPLWTTEGHPRLVPNGDAAAVTARTLLVQWLSGVEMFGWYSWDIGAGEYEIAGPWVGLTEDGCNACRTAAADAYAAVQQWLTGARVDSLSIEGDRWVVRITTAEHAPAWIVWRTNGGAADYFRVPSLVTRVRHIDGTSHHWRASRYPATARPVLFEGEPWP